MRYRNILTRSLGRDDLVQADIAEEPLNEGDVLIVCSDGVSGKVADTELLSVATDQSPPQAVASLIALAKLNGSRDDASIVVARWQHPPAKTV